MGFNPVDLAFGNMDAIKASNKRLRSENAKLRELVRDLWLQLLNAYDRKEVYEFAERMRELGIEVDE